MTTQRPHATFPLVAALALTAFLPAASPAPARAPATPPAGTAVFAGGCYWGVESVFRHVRGVDAVVSGFATPSGSADPDVKLPAGHRSFAEAVKITYDPAKVTYQQLLEVLFTVAHDPTQLDRQGPDVGTRYRSAVFVENDDQYRAVRSYLDQLKRSGVYHRPIVTELVKLKKFRAAAPDQQNFAEKHPDLPYIQVNDVPKVEALKTRLPDLYREP